MTALETTLGSLIAITLVAVAVYFAWRQRLNLRLLLSDAKLSREHRRYVIKQYWRRLFGSFLLILLAAMLVGSLFLDYDPLRTHPDEITEAAKNAVRFLSFYWMTLLLLLMVIMSLAVFDLWATARHGVEQQKLLAQEHQRSLEAELARHRFKQSDLN